MAISTFPSNRYYAPVLPRRTTLDDLRKGRVRDAAAILDEHKPNWYRRIDLGKFNLMRSPHCVLGQAFGARFFRVGLGYPKGLDFLRNHGWQGENFVFAATNYEPIWRDEIERRQQAHG